MKKFFRNVLCCGSVKYTDASAITSHRNILENSDQRQPNVELELEQKEVVKKKLARIDSIYTTTNLNFKCSNFRPTGGGHIKYNCPICFRFFERILITSCCANYLCHFCTEDMNQSVIKDAKATSVRCPFCNDEEISLKDVDPTEKPKRYTDSPSMSVKSRIRVHSQQSEQLTANLNTKLKGKSSLFRLDEVVSSGPKLRKMDASFESEHLMDLEQDFFSPQKMKRCLTEPATIEKSNRPVETAAIRKRIGGSVNEANMHQFFKLSIRKLHDFEDPVIGEVSIGLEATPRLPNNEIYKRSYDGE